jgi:hypothetical protein
VKLILSKRGARSAQRITGRWHAHADAPNTFAHEFLEVVELLVTTRSPGSPFPTASRPSLKRLLLRKSQCHIYFVVDERRQVIEIIEVWDARRGRTPKL